MRLLAESYPPEELNLKGYGMYLDFRPENDGHEWGKKSEMKMKTILDCRKPVEPEPEEDEVDEEEIVILEQDQVEDDQEEEAAEVENSRKKKKARIDVDLDDSLDEFDRELEDDLDFESDA